MRVMRVIGVVRSKSWQQLLTLDARGINTEKLRLAIFIPLAGNFSTVYEMTDPSHRLVRKRR